MRARITAVAPADNYYSLRHHFENHVIDASQMTQWKPSAADDLAGYYSGKAHFDEPPIEDAEDMTFFYFLAVELQPIEGEQE